MIRSIILSAFLIINCFLSAAERGSSAPYISGDTFRDYADFVYDEISKKINPSKVKYGNTIFVKTDYIEEFFSKIHPKISKPYILITHNSDYHVPGNCAGFLDDKMLIAWFGQNVENCNHTKMHPIPIGLANKCWDHGNVKIFETMQSITVPRDILLYMNFTVGTFYEERAKVAELFKGNDYCYVSQPKELSAYLADLAQSKFVLSPRGNGLDCHRTWEALLMGAIPIVRTSSLDPMYKNLPVVIVNGWEEIDADFLQKKYEEFQSQKFDLDKMYIDYWLTFIDSYKTKRNKHAIR